MILSENIIGILGKEHKLNAIHVMNKNDKSSPSSFKLPLILVNDCMTLNIGYILAFDRVDTIQA